MSSRVVSKRVYMKFVGGLFLGIIVGVLLCVAAGYLAITNGLIPARGDVAPDQLETWAAHKALHAVLNREATDKSPLEASEKNLMAGAKVYGSNCSFCHGTPKDPTPSGAKGFNPGPTLFADGDMVTDDPEGFTHWKIEHGIKFTGMPTFSPTLSKDEIWQVTLFLKNMDKLPPKVDAYWKAMK